MLQNSLEVCRNFQKLRGLVISHVDGQNKQVRNHDVMMIKSRITNLTQRGRIAPVKIRFDETFQFSEVSANVSGTTFLSGLQKLPKIARPRDITF